MSSVPHQHKYHHPVLFAPQPVYLHHNIQWLLYFLSGKKMIYISCWAAYKIQKIGLLCKLNLDRIIVRKLGSSLGSKFFHFIEMISGYMRYARKTLWNSDTCSKIHENSLHKKKRKRKVRLYKICQNEKHTVKNGSNMIKKSEKERKNSH